MGKIYEKTVWVDEITPLDADNMNKIENAIESLSSMAVSNISDGKGKGSVVQIGNVASGDGSAAFGVGNTATGMGSHAEGLGTIASAKGSHAEGWQSVASGEYSHAEGQSNATAFQSHAENNSTASGEQSHSEGTATASGKRSHAEGSEDALAKGDYSHAEAAGKAYGERSHAEGSGRTGQPTGEAGAWEAHAEGAGVALGVQSHAEGNGTVASGAQSHAQGVGNTASGEASHAQGVGNTASGKASHAQGIGNEALAEGEFVTGKYSNPGQNAVGDTVSGFLVRVGSGTSNTDRSNCFTIDADETVSMKKAVISTNLISRPFSVINKDYADNQYLGKSGGTVSGNVTIQGDLTVAGTTTTETEKQLLVEANVIATNANKQPLGALLSGLAINKNANDTYGLMYDPTDDTVKFGQGTLDTNSKFIFSENEGRPIAIRDDSDKFTDGHFVKWQASSNSFVDAGVDEKTVRPTIGSVGVDQNVLSSIIYTPESSIPTSAIEGVEYACTDLIGEGDLDGDLQKKINSALTQTTADERYVQKGTYTDTILTASEGTVLVMAEGEAALRIYVGPSFDTSTGLYKAYSNSGQSIRTTASQLDVDDKFFVMPWYTYTAASPDGTTTYWEAPLYYQVTKKTEQTVGSDKQYFVQVIMHYANKAQ